MRHPELTSCDAYYIFLSRMRHSLLESWFFIDRYKSLFRPSTLTGDKKRARGFTQDASGCILITN